MYKIEFNEKGRISYMYKIEFNEKGRIIHRNKFGGILCIRK